MLKVLIFITLIFSFNVSFSKTSRISKRSSVRYNFKYNAKWYSKLSSKQKKVYLNVMSRLGTQLARAGQKSAQIDRIIEQLFIEEAHAGFSNGYSSTTESASAIDRRVNRASFYGEFYPSCPTGQTPCAIYMGLVNGVAACSNSNTGTCKARGDRDALKRELDACNGRNNDRCDTLNKLMAVGTDVREYCRSRKTQGYCKAAEEALDEAGIQLPKVGNEAPTGQNCNAVSEHVLKQVEARRSDGEGVQHSNNPYWRNVTRAARSICGNNERTVLRKIGTCNVSNMGASGVTTSRNKTYNRGAPGYDQCLRDRRNSGSEIARRNTNDRMEAAEALKSAMGRLSGSISEKYSGAQARIRDLRNQNEEGSVKYRFFQTQLGLLSNTDSENMMERRLGQVNSVVNHMLAPETCSAQREEGLNASGTEFNNAEALRTIFSRLQSGSSLSTTQENQFAAAVGMNSRHFRSVFCNSNGHEQFKRNLNSRLNAGGPRITGPDDSIGIQNLKGQAGTAFSKLRICARALERASESQCGFHNVGDANTLRQASAQHPILARNKKTGRCVAVTRYERRRVDTGRRNANGQRQTRLSSSLFLDDATASGQWHDNIDLQQFAREYDLQEYGCRGDRGTRPVYTEDGHWTDQ